MKQGFTLIEILVATAIASLLVASLFLSYAQMQRSFSSARNYLDFYDSAILVQHQFTRDVAGAFIPTQAQKPKKEKKDAKTPVPQQEEAKAPVLKDPFVSKNRDGKLHMISFITNNPMRVYVGKKTGEPKPYVVRVVYTFEQDKESSKDKPRYTLYRQEGTDLNLLAYTKADSAIERYALARNVTSATISFEVSEEKQGKVDIKAFEDWQLGKDTKDIRSKLMLPEKVTLELVLTDDQHSKEKEFIFTVVLMTGFSELPPVEPVSKPAAPVQPKGPAKPGQEEQRKELLVSGANRVVDNIRGLFGA